MKKCVRKEYLRRLHHIDSFSVCHASTYTLTQLRQTAVARIDLADLDSKLGC